MVIHCVCWNNPQSWLKIKLLKNILNNILRQKLFKQIDSKCFGLIFCDFNDVFDR